MRRCRRVRSRSRSIAFSTSSRARAAASATSERRLEAPYVKDYDANGDRPAEWAKRFDVARWGLLSARVSGTRVGGAVIAFDSAGVTMLEQRRDLAVLWDLRVRPDLRARGIGAMLFRAADTWAAGRGCAEIRVETQNTNVPACRFYARQGCSLRAIDRFAYPHRPDEIQLLWDRFLT